MTRPLTTRDARRAYLDSTRVPRVSKAEERRREREELERIREEERQGRERARARAARERKRAREDEEKAERRRRGEPVVRVTASQGMISAFFGRGRERKGGGGGERGAAAGGKAECGDQRSVTDEREGVDNRDEDQRNTRCEEAQVCAESGSQELDDLFLSASQLDREVGRTSQTPRKRSRDEAFRRPDPPPPKPPDRAIPRPPADPGPEEPYDLGVSSQELLQVEARETRRRSVLGEDRDSARGSPGGSSKGIPGGPGVPAEPAEPNASFAESFVLCSQDLRELDALAHLPTGDSTSKPPRNTEPDKDPDTSRVELDARGPATAQDSPGGEESRPPPTSGKGPVPGAETRSCTMPKEGLQRGTDMSPSQGKPRDAGSMVGRKHVVTKGGTCPKGDDGGKAVEQVRADIPWQSRDSGAIARAAKPGPASPDLDDDEWWEDLDDTDLAALLECPA